MIKYSLHAELIEKETNHYSRFTAELLYYIIDILKLENEKERHESNCLFI
jgi:hypothetical protein